MLKYSVFADFCKKYRYCLLFTQQQFADYLHVSLSTIKKWESGTVRIPAKWLFSFQADIESSYVQCDSSQDLALVRRMDSCGILDLLSQAISCSIPVVVKSEV